MFFSSLQVSSDVREADRRGNVLHISPDLLAFYLTRCQTETQLSNPAIGVIAEKAGRGELAGPGTKILKIPCSIAAVLRSVSAAC